MVPAPCNPATSATRPVLSLSHSTLPIPPLPWSSLAPISYPPLYARVSPRHHLKSPVPDLIGDPPGHSDDRSTPYESVSLGGHGNARRAARRDVRGHGVGEC